MQADVRNSVFNDVGGNYTVNNYNIPSPDEEKVLATLKPVVVERRGYDVPGCMEGTRLCLFEEIDIWLNDFGAPNVLWISGSPGAGKSAVASSLVTELTKRRQLASHFFCKRDHASLSNPAVIWRTVASDLARFNPQVKTGLLEFLRKTDFRDADILLHFHCLIVEPLKNSDHSSALPPVVVLDALDECGPGESQSAQRRILLETIASWSFHLPPWCKLIVTSRDDRVPTSFHNSRLTRHIVLETGDFVSRSTADDIRIFFEKSFAYITPELGLPSIWPGIPKKKLLTKRAAGLFIWAKTTIAFIAENSGNPSAKLQLILDGELGKGKENIDSLYRQILHFAFKDASDDTLELFKGVVGTIIAAKIPICRNDLKYFLGREDDEDDRQIGVILHKLSSVIAKENDGLLRLMHLSFVEFLSDEKRGRRFFIDQKQYRRKLALGCMRILNRGLKFNICGLETSYCRNNDMKKSTPVPAHLSYACRFWAEHLEEDNDRHDRRTLLKEMRNFLYNLFLFWLEVLSLTEEVPVAQRALLAATRWLGRSDKELSAFAKDARRFVVCFQVPISESVPHIYLSALPFSPRKSKVAKHFLPHFPHTLSVTTGRSDRWPAILNVFNGHSSYVMSASFSPDGKHIVSGSADETIFIWDAETGRTVSGPFKGHTDYIRSVAFSPDGKYVVSGSDDTTICLWDVETSQMVWGPIREHTDFVRSVAFSPDGKHIVSGSSDKTIRIWDALTGKVACDPFEGHVGGVMSVAFSPDGNHVVSGSEDNNILLWNVATGRMAQGPFIGHIDDVRSVAFSPDGKFVVSSSADHTVRIWDVVTGQTILGPLKEHTDYVRSAVFSPDGKRIVSAADDKTIRIWDVETGKTVLGPLEGHTDYIRSIAFSPDGKRLVSSSDDKTICIWDAMSGMTVKGPVECRIHYVRSVAFSHDGKHIVSASDDEHVRIWNTETGEMALGPFIGHTDYIRSVAFSPNSDLVVSGADDNTVRIWDAETGQPLLDPLTGHDGHVLSVAFSPDGKHVVSGSDDETIRIWDAKTGQTVGQIVGHTVFSPFDGHTDYVRSVVFSPDGSKIISGSDDKTIRVWDVGTCKPVLGPFKGHGDYVTSVAVSHDGRRVVSGSDDETIRIWDIATGSMVSGPFRGHRHGVRSVAFSPDDKCIVSGSADKTIRIWDIASCQTIAGPFIGHTDYVRSVTFSPDGKLIASGSDDETIRIWDVASGETVMGPFTGQTRYVRSVAFSPDGNHIASGSDDKTIYIWDAETGQRVVGPFVGHTGFVKSVAFSPDGKRIVSGSDDETVRIWDAATGLLAAGPFRGHTDYVKSVAFSADGKTVVSGSDDKTVRVWDADTGDIVSGPFQGHTEYVMSVGFSPNGKLVVSGSDDETIRIWDVATGKMVLGPLKGHTGHVLTCAFSPDGKRVISGAADKTVRMWDVSTGRLTLGPFEGHTGCVTSVAFSPDGELVASGSGDMTIRIWNAATGQTVSGPYEGHTQRIMSVAFSHDGTRIVSGSADKTIRVWDAKSDRPASGPSLCVTVAHPPTDRNALSGSVSYSPWNVESSTLPRGFLLDNSDGWASSHHSMDLTEGSGAPLLFWVPPHNRRGICGSETITIAETPLHRLDFSQFMHGSSWAQCYQPQALSSKRSPSPLRVKFEEVIVPQARASSVPLRIFVFLVLIGILDWLGGVHVRLLRL